MALLLDNIRAVVHAEVRKALTQNSVIVGTTFLVTTDPNGERSYTAQPQSGDVKPDDVSVNKLTDLLTNVLFGVLNNLAEVEVTVAGTVQGTSIEGTGTGKLK